MSSTRALKLVDESGWRSGFRNLLRKENDLWWGTRKWWIQSLVWSVIPILLILPGSDPENATKPAEYLGPYLRIFSDLSTFGVAILMMSAIVDEKRSGTAAWIMSNPASRSSFILSKLIANVIGIFVIVIGMPGLLAFVLFSAKGGIEHGAMAFFTGMGLNALHAFFYITLALLLGSFFNGRGPVIGISIGFLIGQDLFGQLLAPKVQWLPVWLPRQLRDIAVSVSMGRGIDSTQAILSTSVLSLLFVVVAIWKFKREEF